MQSQNAALPSSTVMNTPVGRLRQGIVSMELFCCQTIISVLSDERSRLAVQPSEINEPGIGDGLAPALKPGYKTAA